MIVKGLEQNNVITSWESRGVEYHSWIGFIKTLPNLGNCEQKTMAPQILTYSPESKYQTEKESWTHFAQSKSKIAWSLTKSLNISVNYILFDSK